MAAAMASEAADAQAKKERIEKRKRDMEAKRKELQEQQKALEAKMQVGYQ